MSGFEVAFKMIRMKIILKLNKEITAKNTTVCSVQELNGYGRKEI